MAALGEGVAAGPSELAVAKATSRASANETTAQPPSPSVRGVPRITSRCTQLRIPVKLNAESGDREHGFRRT